MSKVTIVTPVYNVEAYLPACLDSILQQTMPDFEAILVDDGSTDQSGNICESYAKKDKRFKVIHQKNSGVSAARNHALKLAKSDYITFLDSDDQIGQHYLERLLAAAQKYQADIAVSPIQKIADQPTTEILSKTTKKVSPQTATTNLLYGKNDAYWGGPGAKLYKSNIIKNQFFRTDLKYSEDVDFFYQAIQKCRTIIALTYSGYMYRIRPGSATQTSFKPDFMQHRLEYYNSDLSHLDPSVQAAWRSNITYNMIFYMSLMNKKSHPDCWKTAWKIIKQYRTKVILDPNQKRDQKLATLLTYAGPTIAAKILKLVINYRTKQLSKIPTVEK